MYCNYLKLTTFMTKYCFKHSCFIMHLNWTFLHSVKFCKIVILYMNGECLLINSYNIFIIVVSVNALGSRNCMISNFYVTFVALNLYSKNLWMGHEHNEVREIYLLSRENVKWDGPWHCTIVWSNVLKLTITLSPGNRTKSCLFLSS